ncbi:hypothetical protein EYF80_000301 [Liparis tanakae]|uniref:Uncharacterized protein n=1 Tax=Liparis tanakae TaxID=230148 RepID=A0A4Z2JJ80_9TELE|nr:hypothetical protein EYF80_000301 [Liparis tanakae]
MVLRQIQGYCHILSSSTLFDPDAVLRSQDEFPQRPKIFPFLTSFDVELRSPAEKGTYAYGGLPTEFSGRKRSGRNASGSGKYRGSRWSA